MPDLTSTKDYIHYFNKSQDHLVCTKKLPKRNEDCASSRAGIREVTCPKCKQWLIDNKVMGYQICT